MGGGVGAAVYLASAGWRWMGRMGLGSVKRGYQTIGFGGFLNVVIGNFDQFCRLFWGGLWFERPEVGETSPEDWASCFGALGAFKTPCRLLGMGIVPSSMRGFAGTTIPSVCFPYIKPPEQV